MVSIYVLCFSLLLVFMRLATSDLLTSFQRRELFWSLGPMPSFLTRQNLPCISSRFLPISTHNCFFSLLFIYSFVNYDSLWPLFLTLPCTFYLLLVVLPWLLVLLNITVCDFHHRCGQSIKCKSFSIS